MGARALFAVLKSLLEETNASGVAQADYIYLNGRPIATLVPSTGALYYLHDDSLGTPQLATDGSQNAAWQASYEPFGQASLSGAITQNLRFPGQYFDSESGWNHNGFRNYIPDLGRYAEPDPFGRAGSGNSLYVYVHNDPVRLVDLLGLCPSCKLEPGLAPFINDWWFGTVVDTILGEESPQYVESHNQYQYGDTLGSPTGPEITNSTLDSEAYLIASSMVNRGFQRGLPLRQVVAQPRQYTSYTGDTARIHAALRSPNGSAACMMLNRAAAALASAMNHPGPYSDYRAQIIPKIGNRPAHVVGINGREWVGRSVFF